MLLDAALSQLPRDTFQVSVAGDEVEQGKPHPEPYETRLPRCGCRRPAMCRLRGLDTGARSGNAAGALVVAVPNRVPIPPAPAGRHVSSLAELDAAEVARLLEQANGRADRGRVPSGGCALALAWRSLLLWPAAGCG